MTIQYTPGPWTTFECLTGAISINVNKKIPIATVGGSGWHLGEQVAFANARLIAAAPELLVAAQAMADSFADCVKTELALSEFPALADLVAAIAKAKGQ